MGISGVSGVLNKLVNKGSVNMVTGGATLTAKAVENAVYRIKKKLGTLLF